MNRCECRHWISFSNAQPVGAAKQQQRSDPVFCQPKHVFLQNENKHSPVSIHLSAPSIGHGAPSIPMQLTMPYGCKPRLAFETGVLAAGLPFPYLLVPQPWRKRRPDSAVAFADFAGSRCTHAAAHPFPRTHRPCSQASFGKGAVLQCPQQPT